MLEISKILPTKAMVAILFATGVQAGGLSDPVVEVQTPYVEPQGSIPNWVVPIIAVLLLTTLSGSSGSASVGDDDGDGGGSGILQ